MAPFVAAESSATRNSLLFIGLIGISSLAALLALFWAQSSRLNKRLYENSSQLANAIFSRLPVGLLINNLEGKVIFVNRALLKMSGLKEEDFLDRRLETLISGNLPKEEEFTAVETDMGFQGGKSTLVSITGGPVVGQDGHSIGRVLLMADLGEIGRLKTELAQKERLATLGSMARGLAHELRNPLGAIKGLTYHLSQVKYIQPTEREALDVILTSVDRLAGTITDFLDYARPLELRVERVSLGKLLTKLKDLVIHDPNSQNVQHELILPKEELFSDSDETKLSQAFLNLYLNAIQATSGNPSKRPGKVTVTLEHFAEGLGRIIFSDNGPGFSKTQLSRPFVPYFTSKAKGTGLGLALSKKIVEAHDGNLIINNNEEGGAIVTVSIPIKPQNKKKNQFAEPFMNKSDSDLNVFDSN
jgi:two-component system sensor histidine kinase HydH